VRRRCYLTKALQLTDLALRNIKKRWRAAPTWQAALVPFAILFPDRFHPEPRFG